MGQFDLRAEGEQPRSHAPPPPRVEFTGEGSEKSLLHDRDDSLGIETTTIHADSPGRGVAASRPLKLDELADTKAATPA